MTTHALRNNSPYEIPSAARTLINRLLGPALGLFRGVRSDSFESQYLKLVRDIMKNGVTQSNRTGIDARSIHGAFIRFDISKGFPALTTKRLMFKSVKGELCGFLRGATSAADFRALGCNVWNQNANENEAWLANPFREETDHLGPVYGAQWRAWPAYKTVRGNCVKEVAQIEHLKETGWREVARDGDDYLFAKSIDQLADCVNKLLVSPNDRRILFHGWNPAALDAVALPACHILYIFSANTQKRELSLSMTMRSTDVGLGLPFNAASAALLLELVARLTGFTAKMVSISMADAHIYENQFDMVHEQLGRIPYAAPTLKISSSIPTLPAGSKMDFDWLSSVVPDDFDLAGYKHHAPLTAPMAV